MRSYPITVLVPLLNPNEPEAFLASVNVENEQEVHQGDLLCTLETTKTTGEAVAEADGFIAGLQWKAGDTVRAGDLFCFLAETSRWQPDSEQMDLKHSSELLEDEKTPTGLRITRPALDLARLHALDLDALPRNVLVTESVVRTMISASTTTPTGDRIFDPTQLVIYGGGGHGKSVLELVRASGIFQVVGFVDDGMPEGEMILDLPVLGTGDQLATLYERGIHLAANAVGGIGNLAVRLQVFERIKAAGFSSPRLIHPTAWVEPSAVLEAGVQIFPHAYIGSDSRLGFGGIVNTAAIVSHDCHIEAYANLSPGATLAGGVSVGRGALVGMRATINLLVKIGAGARIGNGATVKADVPENGVVAAGSVWPK